MGAQHLRVHVLERERKAAAKDGKSDEKRRESARRAGAKVRAATVDFDAERERAAEEAVPEEPQADAIEPWMKESILRKWGLA